MNTEALLDELEKGRTPGEQMSFEQMPGSEAAPAAVKTKANGTAVKKAAPTPKIAPKPAAAPHVTGRHQDVRLYLTILLKTFVEMTDSGLVREAPFWVKMGSGIPIEPDLLFVSSANFDKVHETHVDGAPDLIMEIVSAETTAEDRGDKFVAYEAAGVREYWLLDPVRELANLYLLGPDGRYDESRPDTANRLRSRILKNFVLDTGNLWRRILPTTVEVVESVNEMIAQK